MPRGAEIRFRVTIGSVWHETWRDPVKHPGRGFEADLLIIGRWRAFGADHVVVFGDRHLRRLMDEYVTYYHEIVGGLHHRYGWQTAA